jgi:serine/threonine protein phosphatase PrpC
MAAALDLRRHPKELVLPEDTDRAQEKATFYANLAFTQGKEKSCWADIRRRFEERIGHPALQPSITRDGIDLAAYVGSTHEGSEDVFSQETGTHQETPYRLLSLADGHLGREAAKTALVFLKDYFPSFLERFLSPIPPKGSDRVLAITRLFKSLFVEADEKIGLLPCGTTLLTSFLFDGQLFTASAGDSVAYLVTAESATQVSVSADLTSELFLKSIRARGSAPTTEKRARSRGELAPVWRVCHLNVGRSLGDKKRSEGARYHPLSPRPKIAGPFDEPKGALVLCSDGVDTLIGLEDLPLLFTHPFSQSVPALVESCILAALERLGRSDDVTLALLPLE